MKLWYVYPAMAFVLMAWTGCARSQRRTGGEHATPQVATVDLERVARELQWSTRLHSDLEEYRLQLRREARHFADGYDEQIRRSVLKMVPADSADVKGYQLTPEESRKLAALVASGHQQVHELTTQGDHLYDDYRRAWVQEFRSALAPITRQVAIDNGIDVVVAKNDQVLFSLRSVDVTQLVVDQARLKPPVLQQVPQKHLTGPTTLTPDSPRAR